VSRPHSVGNGQSLKTVLGKVNIPVQKNEVEPLPYTTYKI
jgi:hypothetical protein